MPAPAATAAPAPTPTPAPTPSPVTRWTTRASVVPTTVHWRHCATVSVSITASRRATVLVDLEIYNAAGRRVARRSWSAVAFAAGTPRTLRWSCYASSTRATGTYTVKVGVFRPGWTGRLAWGNTAARVRVVR